MEVTATMVKELREMTGAGMMDCKAALAETAGDMEKAVDVLRTKGLADLAKKAGRATNEGLIAAFVDETGKVACLAEMNCETDFVGRNAEFGKFVQTLAEQVASEAPDGIAEGSSPLLSQAWKGNPSLTVEQALGELVSKLGENMTVTRFERYELEGPATIGAYVHGVGRIGVLVEIVGSDVTAEVATFAKDVAMHVAASNPGWVRSDEVPADVIEHEMGIYKAQAAESGKPEPIQEKIAQGRLAKFYKEVCLVEQPFVKDPDISVEALTKKVSSAVGAELSIARFTRWSLGETSTETPPASC